MSVLPSVRSCAKVMYTKTKERVKIIGCGFLLQLYTGNRSCQNFDPNARRLTKLKLNDILNDFSISEHPTDRRIGSDIFYFKDFDQKISPDPNGPDRTKTTEIGAKCPFCHNLVLKNNNHYNIFQFSKSKSMSKLSNFDTDRTIIAEVRAE